MMRAPLRLYESQASGWSPLPYLLLTRVPSGENHPPSHRHPIIRPPAWYYTIFMGIIALLFLAYTHMCVHDERGLDYETTTIKEVSMDEKREALIDAGILARGEMLPLYRIEEEYEKLEEQDGSEAEEYQNQRLAEIESGLS